MSPLPLSFYLSEDVVSIACSLLGKKIFTQKENSPKTGGIIVETESYFGEKDKASHAYKNRRTKRNEAMYKKGGIAYVYLCYGIHHLLNIVTNKEGIPHAVLIRAIEPIEGIEEMEKRREKKVKDRSLTAGPGALSTALGITIEDNGLSLESSSLWLEEGIEIASSEIIASPRVGVGYAQEDALLPLRFRIRNSSWTSPAK